MAKTENKPTGNGKHSGTSASRSAEEIESPTRRSLLKWLGNASVYALTADFLAACAESNNAAPESAENYPFRPTPEQGPLYDKWWGNTVDTQNLSNLDEIIASWQLKVSGLVEAPTTLSFSDILALTRQNQITDFHCVEGWSVYDVPWNGFHIDKLIELVRPTSEATHINLRCFGDIYTESLPLSVAREPRTMFAYGIGGSTIPQRHGFPLRLVIPRLYGYKNAKWVKEIEFTNAPLIGYWEPYGYTIDGEVVAWRLRDGKY